MQRSRIGIVFIAFCSLCLGSLALVPGCLGDADRGGALVSSASNKLSASRFSGWRQLEMDGLPPGGLTSALAIARGGFSSQGGAIGTDGVFAFARGSNGEVYQTSDLGRSPPSFSRWTSLEGNIIGKPAVAKLSGSTCLLVGRGTNNQIFARAGTPFSGSQGFSPWSQVSNGNLISAPAITVTNGIAYVFANGTDNRVYFSKNDILNGYRPESWENWQLVPGGYLTSDPAAVATDGGIFVASRGSDNKYYLTISSTSGQTWSNWAAIPSSHTFASGPALVREASGRLSVLGTSAVDGSMLTASSTDDGASWTAFESAGGNLLYAPSAVALSSVVEAFGVGTNHAPFVGSFRE